MTTLPLCRVYLKLECLLSFRRPLPFNTGGLGRTDGWTDKNRQTIAVPLSLHFAARVNNNIIAKKVHSEAEKLTMGSRYY